MFEIVQKLPDIDELKRRFPATSAADEMRKKIERVISGKDERMLLVVGPCSMDSESAIYFYVEKLMEFAAKIEDKFVVVPRLYTSKPRSLAGFRGLIHSPNVDGDDLAGGIVLCRKILSGVLTRFGVCGADELLYPELFGYFDDLLAYAAVGARSSENQQHRMFASGLDMPVGLKNPLSGSVSALVNSVLVARQPNNFSCGGSEVRTGGNDLAHAIFRGYTDAFGASKSNTDLEYFDAFLAAQKTAQKRDLTFGNQSKSQEIPFLVDISHDNSVKNYQNQPKVLAQISQNLKNSDYKRLFRGVMMESYLVEGRNDGERISGRSYTDACPNLSQTERAILDFLNQIG